MRWQIEPIPAWRWEKHAGRDNPFSAPYEDTLDLLWRELEQLGARDTVAVQIVCSPSDIRRDGMLRATARPLYRGVAVSFESKHGPLTYPCDTFVGNSVRPGWQANLRAIALGLEALRKVDRYGVAGRGEQYAGWRAIAAGPAPAFVDAAEALAWLRDLTRRSGAPVVVGQLLRQAAGIAHPDRNGGDRVLWDRYDAARQLLEGGSRR